MHFFQSTNYVRDTFLTLKLTLKRDRWLYWTQFMQEIILSGTWYKLLLFNKYENRMWLHSIIPQKDNSYFQNIMVRWESGAIRILKIGRQATSKTWRHDTQRGNSITPNSFLLKNSENFIPAIQHEKWIRRSTDWCWCSHFTSRHGVVDVFSQHKAVLHIPFILDLMVIYPDIRVKRTKYEYKDGFTKTTF